MPIKGFDYNAQLEKIRQADAMKQQGGTGGQAASVSSAPAAPPPVSKPVPPESPVNSAEIERQQHLTAPEEPLGTGLVEPPAGKKSKPYQRQMEYGGGSSEQAPPPVVSPPERPPAPPPKLHPKDDGEIKIHSSHGSDGVGGLFADTANLGFIPPEQDRPAPTEDAVGSLNESADPAVLADIERKQMEAEIRAKVEAEWASKHPPKPGKSKTGGKTAGTSKAVQTAYIGKGVSRKDVQMSHLKQVPKCLVQAAMDAFPEATRQDDAVAAYIYFREGMPEDMKVPDEIAVLARSFSGESLTIGSVKDIVERDIQRLEQQNRELSRKMDVIELAAAYMIFQASGFQKDDPDTPGAFNFLAQGMVDLLRRLEAQTETKRQRERYQEGRPLK